MKQYHANEHLRANLKGIFSNLSIEEQWDIYKSHICHVNALNAELESMQQNQQDGSCLFADRRRRIHYEFNELTLHEDFFSSLSPQSNSLRFTSESPLRTQIELQFRLEKNWWNDLKKLSHSRGIQWIIAAADLKSHQLYNLGLCSSEGIPAGMIPLLTINLNEHAYLRDFGSRGKENYLTAILQHMNLKKAENQYSWLLGKPCV
jgi:superoxide dismutase